jgi:phosphoribosylamine---glycine ligase
MCWRGLTAFAGGLIFHRLIYMKILVIGSGAREHAIIWKLRQSAKVDHIWCAPGNAGVCRSAECLDADTENVTELAELAERLKPHMTIVGPEKPLVLGIADEFEKRGLRLLGPSRGAAQLEGSKVFAKEFMARHGIPTAPTYGVFDSAVDAYTSLCQVDWPVVVKADGLCGGKGVLVTSSPDEATAFIERVMEKGDFGEAGDRVIIEEGLSGPEVSYIVLTDGENFIPLAPTRDYKRAFDGNAGPNTGGMGAISYDQLLSHELEKEIREKIVSPTIKGMAGEGHNYLGFLYFGLMITAEGPRVLEFNCRLGDPETEALVMRMDFDLAAAADAVMSGRLESFNMEWSPGASACIVLAAGGYPGKPNIGGRITGIPMVGDDRKWAIFHGGTSGEGGNYYVSSGRVLTVAAAAGSVATARAAAYEMASAISFDGMHYRRDIGGEVGNAVGSQ